MPAVRLLFWAQAKHRAGLERPHFLGFQPPKTSLESLQPSVWVESADERRKCIANAHSHH